MALQGVIPPAIGAALLLARGLTAREFAVFEWLGQGYDNRSIAREMNISERTVKRHVTVILAKLRLESRLQAGLAALFITSVTVLGAASLGTGSLGGAPGAGRDGPKVEWSPPGGGAMMMAMDRS
jgi:DNA-binding CsgD family transcriptional regulator